MMLNVEPPDPTKSGNLDEPIDWLVYSHQDLYNMVHDGVDLPGAAEVATAWGDLASTLVQMNQTLRKALSASTDGWQGAGADQARSSLSNLVEWAHGAGESANAVSGCVSRQADALQAARAAMPRPVSPIPPGMPVPGGGSTPPPGTPPPGVAQPLGSTQTASAGFTQPPLTSHGPVVIQSRQAEAHQQAARVMRQYQHSSADVASTIPQFAAPTNLLAAPNRPPTTPTPPQPSPTDQPVAAPVVGGFGGGTGEGTVTGHRGGSSPTGGGGAADSTAAPRPSSGTGAGQEPTGTSSTTTESTPQSGRPAVAGGMGAAGARRGEDTEHKRKYWQEDDGIFELPERVMPPVIGERRD